MNLGALRRPRPRTRPVRAGRKSIVTAQRSCNGCGRRLGDVNGAELHAATLGHPAPDVRDECPVCTPNTPGLWWRLALPITRPLSMNDRMGWRAKHEAKKTLRAAVKMLARHQSIPPLRALTAELHYAPSYRRIRDPINLAETLKVIEDGLVDANLVPDDNPWYVTTVLPIIDPPTGAKGQLYVIVYELDADGDQTSLR